MIVRKKIKRPKDLNSLDKKIQETKMGSPKLEDRELTEEMRYFSVLLAQGLPPKEAGKMVGLSDYQIKTYPELDKIKEHVAILQNKTEVGVFEHYIKKLDDELIVQMYLSLKRQAEEDKIPHNIMLERTNQKKVALGIIKAAKGDQVYKETVIATKTIRGEQPKQIEHDENIIDIDDEDYEEE